MSGVGRQWRQLYYNNNKKRERNMKNKIKQDNKKELN